MVVMKTTFIIRTDLELQSPCSYKAAEELSSTNDTIVSPSVSFVYHASHVSSSANITKQPDLQATEIDCTIMLLCMCVSVCVYQDDTF